MAKVVGPTIADLENMNYNYYITLVSISILIYDFLLTFPAEVERFWFVGRVNWAISLFYLNRYLIIFGYVPILIENFWVTYDPAKMKICRSLQTYHEYFSTAIQVVIAAMLIMRIYALYKRNVRVLVVFVAIAGILFSIGCWAGYGGYTNDVEQDVLVHVGCGVSLSHDRAIRFAASWASMFVFDLLVFGMTLYKTVNFPRSSNASALICVFMRDGAMYFCIIAASTLMSILYLLLGPPLTRDMGVIFTNVISSTMMSRLMLNLRDPSLIPVPGRSASESYLNLTFVESYYPTELSDRLGESSRSHRSRPGYEAEEALDLHRPASSDIEFHRIGV